jgi:hypothetical protein
MGARLINGYEILVGGRWASHRSHSLVADGASSQHVVRTQNVSGSLLQNDRYIVLLYFVIKSDFSCRPDLNPNVGVGSLFELEGEKHCVLASQYSSWGRQDLLTGEVEYMFGYRTPLDKNFSEFLSDLSQFIS